MHWVVLLNSQSCFRVSGVRGSHYARMGIRFVTGGTVYVVWMEVLVLRFPMKSFM